MLRIDSLTATYGAVMALSDVTIRINQGEIVSLLGANGAGKTTLIRAITGLISPKSGSITFLDEDITGRRPEKIAALGIACVPEGRHIFPGLSVEDNLLLGSISRGKVPFYCAAWSNIPSVRNALACGFRPAWVQLTAKPLAFVEKLQNTGK